MIRHGEKPPKLNGEDQEGLSKQGIDRSEALPQVFGPNSSYNIGYILVEKPKKDSRTRPVLTVTPLSQALGIPLDDSISRDDAQGAAQKARDWISNVQSNPPSDGRINMLICWEHGQLKDIAEAIGVTGYADTVPQEVQVKGTEKSDGKGGWAYPDARFDLIWTLDAPYTEINSVTSEKTELDAGHVDP
jgi:hypothetical protein